MDDNLIVDETNERKYFTIIPNLVLELGLSVYAQSLYMRMKRRAGEDGACFESTRNLAEGCKMSCGSVTNAKSELEQAGLITIETKPGKHGGRPYHEIRIVNIWMKNIAYYSQVHPMYLQVSPHELASTPGDTKEEPIKKGAEEKAASSAAPSPFAGANGLNPSTSLKEHPAIKAIKTVTNYYPPKNLYPQIIDLLGEEPDLEKLQNTFDTWIANGYNPKNIKGWLFDWYREGMYYVPPGRKFQEAVADDNTENN